MELSNEREHKRDIIYQSSIGEEELNQIKSVLELNRDENKVIEFEDNMANFVGAKYAVATCNATAAIHLALSAIKLKRGDKILMSVNSFVNVQKLLDILMQSLFLLILTTEDMNIDVNKFEKALAEIKTKKLEVPILLLSQVKLLI